MIETTKSSPLVTDRSTNIKPQPVEDLDVSAIVARSRAKRKARNRARVMRRRRILAMALLIIVTIVAIKIIDGRAPKVEPVDNTLEVPAIVKQAEETVQIIAPEKAEATPTEAPIPLRYELTDKERTIVAQVVMAEAEGEPFAGKVAVAQCILNASEKDGIRPDETVTKYKYAKTRPEPNEEVLEAVAAVFDLGYIAAKDPIIYFYNPDKVASSWHESQDFVIEINNHRFFAEKPNN